MPNFALGEAVPISIHAPRKGERRCPCGGLWPPARYFNPRSPQGGATLSYMPSLRIVLISIHAPRKGERQACCIALPNSCKFQSTLPARGSDNSGHRIRPSTTNNFNPRSPQGGATFFDNSAYRARVISIHAPRKGERRAYYGRRPRPRYFNPRSPQGGATSLNNGNGYHQAISIHAPRKGERRFRYI